MPNHAEGGKKKSRVKFRLHYRLVLYQPDLKLVDFRTVPRVPNSRYPETILCVKAANIGNAMSKQFYAKVLFNDINATEYAHHIEDALPNGSRREFCQLVSTPPEGRYRMRVELVPAGFDHDIHNNKLEKEIAVTKRTTHQEAWRRTRQHVIAYGKQIEELRVALLVNAAQSSPRGANRPSPSHPPRKVIPNNRQRFKRKPPPQTILRMIAEIRSRLLRIQDEAGVLRGTYRELEKKASAEATTEVIDRAKYFYELGGHLDRAVRDDVQTGAIDTYIGALSDGGQAMKRYLNVARKFGPRIGGGGGEGRR